jgi:hypothetical protein
MRNTVVDLASRDDHLRGLFGRYCGLPRPSNTIVVVYGSVRSFLGLCFVNRKENPPGQFQNRTGTPLSYRLEVRE